jgi:septum formation protein
MMEQKPQVYLASTSPRRRQLLAQIGVTFQPISVSVDETPLPQESPKDYVARLALTKARSGKAVLIHDGQNADNSLQLHPTIPVLGADTCVLLDDKILGKPCNRDHGLAMVASLSGREHWVLSAVAMVANQEVVRVQESRVRFRPLSLHECQAYWDTGEPLDKAGGYGIQGRAAAFITELCGSYSGVMGLPLFETTELLKLYGISVL